jgi:hypothetical protein
VLPVNFTEVYAGLRPGEEEKKREFLYSLDFFPITAEIAAQAGLLRRDGRLGACHLLSCTTPVFLFDQSVTVLCETQ